MKFKPGDFVYWDCDFEVNIPCLVYEVVRNDSKGTFAVTYKGKEYKYSTGDAVGVVKCDPRPKFKEGDRVRVLPGWGIIYGPLKDCSVHTVDSVYKCDDTFLVEIDLPPPRGSYPITRWDQDRFELAEEKLPAFDFAELKEKVSLTGIIYYRSSSESGLNIELGVDGMHLMVDDSHVFIPAAEAVKLINALNKWKDSHEV